MKYRSRGFLNKKEGLAAFQSSIDAREGTGTFEYIDAEFTITDCFRRVTLEFQAHDKKAAKERLRKLDTLIDELEKFRVAYEEVLES